MAGCTVDKSPGLDGLHYNLYARFVWRRLNSGEMQMAAKQDYPHFCEPWSSDTAKRKQIKENVIDNFRSVIFFNTCLKIWANVVVERLALVIEKLFNKALTYVVPSRSIYDNLYLIRYVIDSVIKEHGMGEAALISLGQSQAFFDGGRPLLLGGYP